MTVACQPCFRFFSIRLSSPELESDITSGGGITSTSELPASESAEASELEQDELELLDAFLAFFFLCFFLSFSFAFCFLLFFFFVLLLFFLSFSPAFAFFSASFFWTAPSCCSEASVGSGTLAPRLESCGCTSLSYILRSVSWGSITCLPASSLSRFAYIFSHASVCPPPPRFRMPLCVIRASPPPPCGAGGSPAGRGLLLPEPA
mmetsp:Transcript_131724/g.293779  ORF Transcript_131724/g.293779 Transcript_131724/m.293779 type:complete len:205 (-) Transcript_131724:15-629(-)